MKMLLDQIKEAVLRSKEDLTNGALVTVQPGRIRIRRLPLSLLGFWPEPAVALTRNPDLLCGKSADLSPAHFITFSMSKPSASNALRFFQHTPETPKELLYQNLPT
jgi:hypothetical protein